MGRILFFVLLGVAAYLAYRVWSAGQRRNADSAARGPGATSEAMVRCSHCGLNVPRSEALADGGRWYCSDAHRRLDHDPR
jgi:uncharacterized protein